MENKKILLGAVALTLLAVVCWRLGWFDREAPELAELKAIAEKPVGEEQGKAVREVLQQQMKALPDDQARQNYFEAAAPVLIPMFAMQFEAMYDDFMKKSPEEQRKLLDERINEMESRRNRPPTANAQNAGDRSNRPQMDPKRFDEFQKKMVAYTTPQQRAKFEDGMRRFNERRVARGLEPVSPPGIGGRR